MSKLTTEQIDFIADQVNKSKINSNELKEDLIDHFCCIIEDDIRLGKSFEESYNRAYQIVCPNGFDEIHQETILLLTSKNIIIMKKLLFSLGFITTIFLVTSFLFKALHLPGAGVLLVIASFVLIFVFVPLVLLYFYRKQFSKYVSYKMKYVFGYIGLALLLTGAVFKIMHWPGAGLLFMISVTVINFGFLPFLFYRLYRTFEAKEPAKNRLLKLEYIFGFIGVVLFLTASVLKLHHLAGSALLLILSVIVINLGYLPLLFYKMYKKSLC
jgi:hypothetical protein